MSVSASTIGSLFSWLDVVRPWSELLFFDPATMDGDTYLYALFLTALGFVVGTSVIFHGARTYKRYALVRDTPTEEIESVAMGRTELEGTIHPADDPLDQPFGAGRCVYAEWEVEEYRRSGRNNSGSWHTIGSGTIGVPFYVDDGTGKVLVENPREATATISDSNCTTTRSIGGGSGSFLHSRGISPRSSNRRRYTQEVIPPGTEGYVFGEASPLSVTGGYLDEADVKLGPDPASGQFIVSDKCEDSLVSHYRKWGYLFVVGGLGLSAVALYLWLNLAPFLFGLEASLVLLGIATVIGKALELSGGHIRGFVGL